jgi:phosphoglycolate phosphatase
MVLPLVSKTKKANNAHLDLYKSILYKSLCMGCKAVIFDLDGTLVDTLADLGESMNYALANLGQPTHRLEAFRQMVGNGLRTFAKRALPSEKEVLCDQLIAVMRQRYADNCLVNSGLYKGVYETVTELHKRGIGLAVLTNKDQDLAIRIVGHFFATGTFEYVLGALDGQAVKPHGRAVRKLMDMMKVSPSDVILVGDSGVDMDTALAAGVRAIGVSWGLRTRQELVDHKAAVVIDEPAELLNLVG